MVLKPGADRVLAGRRCTDSWPIGWAATNCPAALEFRDSLPKTSVGKLSRKELRDEERAKTAQQA